MRSQPPESQPEPSFIPRHAADLLRGDTRFSRKAGINSRANSSTERIDSASVRSPKAKRQPNGSTRFLELRLEPRAYLRRRATTAIPLRGIRRSRRIAHADGRRLCPTRLHEARMPAPVGPARNRECLGPVFRNHHERFMPKCGDFSPGAAAAGRYDFTQSPHDVRWIRPRSCRASPRDQRSPDGPRRTRAADTVSEADRARAGHPRTGRTRLQS